ncbi:HlyD family efflux transporter periplasmic adaptor subunit [uncultured Mucilaginibacter sp.]|uniref:HlyD family secretion protein n=1 Tax=uncultured Mucilaginibacter sp. TaxID=797541 RepID=UPI0025FFC67A|nr:HlyD family efflux transporter periplasmic adaptor subunit [uncultured Mucilaginibacter sp.]
MKQLFYCFTVLLALAGCSGSPNDKTTTNAPPKASVAITQVVGIGKIVPERDIIQLSSPVNGIVEHIYKNENDSVSAGETVLELQHAVESAQVNQLSSEVNTQYDQIKADNAAVEEYQAKYNNSVLELQRLQRLLAKGAETQQAVDDANTSVKGFQSNLSRLQANAQVSKSKLTETKAALEVSRQQLDQKIIKSPVKGKILEISTLVGSAVNTQTPFVQISPQGKTIADCEIDELFADKISNGLRAWVRNTGSLDTLATGTVYFTSGFLKKKSLFTDQAGEKEDRRVREIKIVLDKPEKLLLNARVECVIDISTNQKR